MQPNNGILPIPWTGPVVDIVAYYEDGKYHWKALNRFAHNGQLVSITPAQVDELTLESFSSHDRAEFLQNLCDNITTIHKTQNNDPKILRYTNVEIRLKNVYPLLAEPFINKDRKN